VVSDVPDQLSRSHAMLLDRGVEVDHSTISRWIQAYAAELEKRIRPHPAREQRAPGGWMKPM